MHVCHQHYKHDCTHYCYWPLLWQVHERVGEGTTVRVSECLTDELGSLEWLLLCIALAAMVVDVMHVRIECVSVCVCACAFVCW